MNKETQDLLKQAFSCPAPKRKKHFLETLRPRKITMADFVIMQVAYIRKAVWVLTFIIFGTAVICAWRGCHALFLKKYIFCKDADYGRNILGLVRCCDTDYSGDFENIFDHYCCSYSYSVFDYDDYLPKFRAHKPRAQQ